MTEKLKGSPLGRPVKIDCCRDGTISVRPTWAKPYNGVALPVFSTWTYSQAEALQTRLCVPVPGINTQLRGMAWMKLSYMLDLVSAGKEPVLEVDQLRAVTAAFQELWDRASDGRQLVGRHPVPAHTDAELSAMWRRLMAPMVPA